jgi:hypothetical protein
VLYDGVKAEAAVLIHSGNGMKYVGRQNRSLDVSKRSFVAE